MRRVSAALAAAIVWLGLVALVVTAGPEPSGATSLNPVTLHYCKPHETLAHWDTAALVRTYGSPVIKVTFTWDGETTATGIIDGDNGRAPTPSGAHTAIAHVFLLGGEAFTTNTVSCSA